MHCENKHGAFHQMSVCQAWPHRTGMCETAVLATTVKHGHCVNNDGHSSVGVGTGQVGGNTRCLHPLCAHRLHHFRFGVV